MRVASTIRRKKRPRAIKIGSLKRKLDKAFKAMIRERDQFEPCISCQERAITEAGHFVRCSPLSTRWHPQNVNGQCSYCNNWLHGNLLEYADNLDKKFGPGTSRMLRVLGNQTWKPNREALEKLLEAAENGPEFYSEIWKHYGAALHEQTFGQAGAR